MKKAADRQKFEKIKQQIEARIAANKAMIKLKKNIRFTETREGLRIDLIDEADFAMFAMATDRLLSQARGLIAEVAKVLQGMPNDVIVRGHTDGLPYAAGRTMNNWLLSSARAEATRKALADSGLSYNRFAKIEGVADREPYIAGDIYDPRNRRMSIVLAWSQEGRGSDNSATLDAETQAAIRERDDPIRKSRAEAKALDMGGTSLPEGAVLFNPGAKSEAKKPGKH
jgi:chemotaxis protein MotB